MAMSAVTRKSETHDTREKLSVKTKLPVLRKSCELFSVATNQSISVISSLSQSIGLPVELSLVKMQKVSGAAVALLWCLL